MTKEFESLEKKLAIKFKNKNLLKQAFVHRSYLNENPDLKLEHNERLEFLGDAVIELIITQHLYKDYPQKPEGEMTNWRAALVNAKMLSSVAEKLGFNDYLLLSRGESKELGKARAYILANAFEAFMGAFYLDSGYQHCDDFLEKHLLSELPNILKEGLYKDSKSKFQEQAQEKVAITPAYKVLKETGPDHNKKFVVGVYLKDKLVAEGSGSSKREAEEAAAEGALEIKKW